MLISAINQNQQAGQGIVPPATQNSQDAAEQAAQENENFVNDIVELSEQSKQNSRVEYDNQLDMERLLEQFENAKAQGEAMGNMMDERIKCLRIAMNIMAGDKVPEEDIRFLAEKDPELFARSMSMRRLDKEVEKAERVTEDEEEENSDSSNGVERRLGGSGNKSVPAKAEAAKPTTESAPATESGAAAAK